jgi:uncharacterized protein YoxC
MATEEETVIEPGTEPAPEPETKPEPAGAQQAGGKVLSNQAIANLRKEAQERGRRAARQALDRDAKAAGFRDHNDMVEKAKLARRGKSAEAPATSPKVEAKAQADVEALRGEVSSLKEANKRLLQRCARLTKDAKRAIRARRDTMAEMELRVAATRHGVKDVDYAVHMLQRKLSSASQDELKAFNEDSYFGKELRRTHAHLYQATSTAATTTPAVKESASEPKPADTAKAAADAAAPKDARNMPEAEYRELLKKAGLRHPADSIASTY